MPPSNNVLHNATDYNAPMAFRRERYWFLSFMMTPFKDIDNRAAEQVVPQQPRQRRGR